MSQESILVVDDEPDIRNLVQEILVDEGYNVSVAENTNVARKHASSAKPDLVLLDIWMPGEDGISLLKDWQSTGTLQ
ncbi:MAG: response regulator, partial [Pseudomonadota bacterium]